VVIGLGNRMRGDDAAGPEVARRLGARRPDVAAIAHEREPSGLLELWDGAGLVLVADALEPAGAPGSVVRLEVGKAPLPERLDGTASTHALSLGTAIELARSLGRLPARLVVYGIEAVTFTPGAPLTPAVSGAVDRVVEAMLHDLECER
jgi:hydrogenase maturation protease